MDALLSTREQDELNAWFDSLEERKMWEHSPEMGIYCSMMCLIANELDETTFKRNSGWLADKGETVVHIILHANKGEHLCSWSCDNGKHISVDMLEELVKEKLLIKRASKARGMYHNPVYIRNF